jgi:cysteinyl-tRNA synthetase
MKIYNSLSRKVEEFSPISKDSVSVYTCGPTVYDYVTVGNWRTYVLSDLMVRTLKYLGFSADYVMNITDVGHLTGDNLGDSSLGEDRQEIAAKKEGKTAQELAKFYTDDFLKGFERLNLVKPKKFTKATEYIDEQIDLLKKIESKGLTYTIDNDGVYFDVGKYEGEGNKYGELSDIDEIKEGTRTEINQNKRDPRDFALWKFSKAGESRHMEWDSPWGVGFPGWHMECSAMVLTELSNQIDIHIGGEDLKSTHHPNEIAQSECVTGKIPFVKYWVHGAFLKVDGGRMGKSLGNAYTLADVDDNDFDALALRYFYLSGHYRKSLNFTWKSIEQAQQSLDRLRGTIGRMIEGGNRDEKAEQEYRDKFKEALENDLNIPQVLAVIWEIVRVDDKDLPDVSKKRLIEEIDQVLGLNLTSYLEEEIPTDILELVNKREEYRKAGDWRLADIMRDTLQENGYEIADTPDGAAVRKIRG